MITIAIYKYLNSLGYNVQRSDLYGRIDKWASWWKGKIKEFHEYEYYNGERYIPCERQSLQLAKTVSETWANLLFNERCLITIDGKDITKDEKTNSTTASYVKNVFDSNNLWARLNEAQELKCVYGTVCYVPRVKNIAINADNVILGGGDIITDVVTADMLIPLSWENGAITELAIASSKTIKGEKYIYVQLFVIEKDEYVIKNSLIKTNDNDSYDTIDDLSLISGFEHVPAKISTQSAMKPFIIDKPNIANNLNSLSPLGISVYANAIDAIKTCDLVFDSFSTEFSLGRTRLFAAPSMLKNVEGKPVFDPRDVMFQILGESMSGKDSDVQKMIEVVQPELRIDEHEKGLQFALNLFSYLCGLGENYYKFNGGSVVTATQVISEQSAAYRTRNKHAIILESAIYDLIKLIIDIGINTLKIQGLNPSPEIKIQFDDSIIEDKTTQKKQDLLEVSQYVMLPKEFRAKWYGETLEQAEEALQDVAEVETLPRNYKELETPSASRLTQKINAAIPQ